MRLRSHSTRCLPSMEHVVQSRSNSIAIPWPPPMRRYKARAIRIVAEDDIVVVEARGEVMTKSEKPCDQAYCYVFELADEEVRELTEYLDTDLVTQVLETPASG